MMRLLAMIVLLVGCAEAPMTPGSVALEDFSQERFCPEHRIQEAVFDEAKPPPLAVAHDPERLAMWLDAAERRRKQPDFMGSTERPPALVSVSGCGDKVLYRCWTEHGWVPTRHGRALVDIMTVCDEDRRVATLN